VSSPKGASSVTEEHEAPVSPPSARLRVYLWISAGLFLACLAAIPFVALLGNPRPNVMLSLTFVMLGSLLWHIATRVRLWWRERPVRRAKAPTRRRGRPKSRRR
jgi:hypothetical protein